MTSVLCAVALLAPACGGSQTIPSGPSGVATTTPAATDAPFSASPVDLAALASINPLGHMTTPFNALPQGRMYLVLRDPGATNPVAAPASGTVVWLLGPKPDYRIQIQVNASLTYFVDHVVPEPWIREGVQVQAGQRIAVHSTRTCCVDFGALNTTVTATYVNRARYSPESINADSPLKYFGEPLRAELYAKVTRVSDGFDGRADYDRPGRLSGNWFLEGTPETGSLLPENWPNQLAFAYSNTHPSMVLVSIAGVLPIVTLCAVQDLAPDPASVSVSSGTVTYQLFQKDPPVSEGNGRGRQLGTLLVRMLDDTRIQVEVFPGSALQAPAFTGAARIYTR